MPQRVLVTVLGILGVLAIAALLLTGADLWKSAATGPRWKRRTLAAGLMLLAAIGIGPSRTAAEQTSSSAPASAPASAPTSAAASQPTSQATSQAAEDPLLSSKQCKCILRNWAAVAQFAASAQSTEAQRKVIDGQLEEIKKATAELKDAKLLTEAEASLLLFAADQLKKGVYLHPPTDVQIMCYKPRLILPAADSAERLKLQVTLLEKVVADGKISKVVMDKIRPGIEADLAVLADKAQLARLHEPALSAATDVAKKAGEVLAKVSKIVKAPAVAAADEKAVARLLARLGSESYKDRKAAQEALVQMGLRIVPLLEKNAKSEDPEVKAIIKTVIQRINEGGAPSKEMIEKCIGQLAPDGKKNRS